MEVILAFQELLDGYSLPFRSGNGPALFLIGALVVTPLLRLCRRKFELVVDQCLQAGTPDLHRAALVIRKE